MPVIDGKVHRSRFTSLKLRELSSVDNPAQPGARMAIMKRDFSAKERQAMADRGDALPDGSYPIANVGDLENAIQAFGRAKNPGKVKAHIISRARALDALGKLPSDWNVKKFEEAFAVAKDIAVDGDEGKAESFQDVLAEQKFNDDVWPCVSALSQSIRSIVGDSSLAGGERDAQISASVNQFLQAVRDISPEVSKQLEPLLIGKRDGPMPKSVEELEKQVGELTGQLTSANALVATEKARADKAEGELATEKAAHGETKKALVTATDDTLKVGEVEVKKSEVGVAQFNLTKGLQDEARMARLEKRAGEQYPNLVGSPAEKALVLKTIDDLPEDNPTRKALEAILTSAEKMVKAGFSRLGGSGGDSPTEKAAQATFGAKVDEVKARDKCSKSQAMSKARAEFPAEFAAAYPDQAPVN